MEFGPRALGNRSILVRAIDSEVNNWLNKRLKRTEFMPFAPITLQKFAKTCSSLERQYVLNKIIKHYGKERYLRCVVLEDGKLGGGISKD